MGKIDELTKEVWAKANVPEVEAALGVEVSPEDATKIIHEVHEQDARIAENGVAILPMGEDMY